MLYRVEYNENGEQTLVPLAPEEVEEIEQRAAEAEVLAQDYEQRVQEMWERYIESEQLARAIPGWATWDKDQALEWMTGKFDESTIAAISNLDDAKAVIGHMATAIQAMALMMMALRDRQWPGGL